MTPAELRRWLLDVVSELPQHADELRALDAALGDGDLGITVSSGARAAHAALTELPSDASVTEMVQAVAKAFSTANPSTFAALVGGGLLAASKTLRDVSVLEREHAVAFLRAVIDRIMERGKTQLGEKTIIDALVPSVEALQASTADAPGALEEMVASATAAVEQTRNLQSARGRAAWVQERSVGHPDPGATAYVRVLEHMRASWGK